MKKIQRILVVIDNEGEGSELPVELQKALRLVTDKSFSTTSAVSATLSMTVVSREF